MLPLPSVSNFKKARRAWSISASVNRTFSAPEASIAIMKKFNGTSEIRPAVLKKCCLLLFRFFARLIARVLLTGHLFTIAAIFSPRTTRPRGKNLPRFKGADAQPVPNEPTNNLCGDPSCCFTKRGLLLLCTQNHAFTPGWPKRCNSALIFFI